MTFRRGLGWLALATLLAFGCDKTLSFDATAEADGGEPGSGGVSGSGLGGGAGSLIGQAGVEEPWLRAGGPGKDPPPATGGTTFVNDEACIDFCASVGQRCDRSDYVCVECFQDEDCPIDRYCDRGLNRCASCAGDRGCPKGKVCDGSTNQCLEQCNVSASSDAACEEANRMCDEDTGRCITCRGDGDCENAPDGPYCLESGARCAECEADFHCPHQKRCDPVLFRCVKCADSRDCELPMVCHPETHECFNADLGVPFPR